MTETTYILGINLFDKDSAACLLADGRIVAAVDEERLIRVKHFGGFPRRSIAYCLEVAGISLDDVHRIVGQLTRREVYERMGESYRPAPPEPRPRRVRDREAERHGTHHLAHAASAYYGSGFDEACVLTADAMGDEDSAVLFVGNGTELKRLWSIPQKKLRIGGVYENVTEQLGFGEFGQGKVMGLAPYGTIRDDWRELLDIRDENTFGSKYLENKSHPLREIRRHPGDEILQEHKDLAATLQYAFEQSITSLVRSAWEQTGIEKFCLAGGVFLNCSLNGKIAGLDFVKSLFVQPNAIDPGTALGMAWYAWADTSDTQEPFLSSALGPEYHDDAILAVLQTAADRGLVRYERVDDPAFRAAEALSSGEIIGWFQGRMEWGPRALGNRSILADPRRKETWERVNRKKGREIWRPLAPSVLAERAEEWFEEGQSNPFMLVARKVKQDKRSLVPAITHVDHTARPQAVDREQHPLFHALIQRFEQTTDVPLVLNTSFNDRNEPIVATPVQALSSFLHMGLDRLIIGHFSVTAHKEGFSRLFPPLSLTVSGDDNIGLLEGLQRQPNVVWQGKSASEKAETPQHAQRTEKFIFRHNLIHFWDDANDDIESVLSSFTPQTDIVSVGFPFLSSWKWERLDARINNRDAGWTWVDPEWNTPELMRWLAEVRKKRLGEPRRILITRGSKTGGERDGTVDPYSIHESFAVERRLESDLRLLVLLGVKHPEILDVSSSRGDLRHKRFRAVLKQGELTIELRYGQKEDFHQPDRIEAKMPHGRLCLESSDTGRRTLLWITPKRRERLWPATAPLGEIVARKAVQWFRERSKQTEFSAKDALQSSRLRERLMESVHATIVREFNQLQDLDRHFETDLRSKTFENAPEAMKMLHSIRNPAQDTFGKLDDDAYFDSIASLPFFMPEEDFWTVLLRSGELPALVHRNIEPENAANLTARYRAESLQVLESSSENNLCDGLKKNLFVAKETAIARRLRELDRSLAQKPDPSQKEKLLREWGTLLDHPDCCTEAAIRWDRQGYDVNRLSPSMLSSHGRYDARCNHLLPGLPLSHIPHHCGCSATMELVEKRLESLKKILADFSKALQYHKLPMLYWDRFRFVVFDGEALPDRIRYQSVFSSYSFRNWPRLDGTKPGKTARLFYLDGVQRLKKGDELVICPDRLEIRKEGQVIDAWKLVPFPRMMFLNWSVSNT